MYAQFVSALSDGFIKRTFQMEGITSLRMIIERGKAIKLIQENNFQHKRENNFEKKKENNYNFNKKGKRIELKVSRKERREIN